MSDLRNDPRSTGATRVESERPTRTVKETRRSFQTTEFFAMIGAIAAVIIVGYAGNDSLDAARIWTLVTVLASAYMISRGLAKAGSRDANERY